MLVSRTRLCTRPSSGAHQVHDVCIQSTIHVSDRVPGVAAFYRAAPLRRVRHVMMTSISTEGFQGFTYFMKPEFATIFSALVAVCSVALNLWGGIIMEQRRAELKQQIEREGDFLRQQRELQSVLARYRGPLLESIVDLEHRLFHIISQLDEWCVGDLVREEEVVHTLFIMAQLLGYMEVVRREGPRERSFLQKGNPQGSDTLAAWVEGYRFVLAADPTCLQEWFHDTEPSRAHPGLRRRKIRQNLDWEADDSSSGEDAASSVFATGQAVVSGGSIPCVSRHPVAGWSSQVVVVDRNGHLTQGGNPMDLLGGVQDTSSAPIEGVMIPSALQAFRNADGERKAASGVRRRPTSPPPVMAPSEMQERFRGLWSQFRLSRGAQRAIGSIMIVTPTGAERHYTMSYGEFYRRLRSDPYFAGWLRPLYEDITSLVASKLAWHGEHVFPANAHTRLLLMQHLLVDAMEFLDPTFIRVPRTRRVRLCPIEYDELPNLHEYKLRLEELEIIFAQAFKKADDTASRAESGNGISNKLSFLFGGKR